MREREGERKSEQGEDRKRGRGEEKGRGKQMWFIEAALAHSQRQRPESMSA